MKKCSKCEIFKELSDFNESKLYSDGKRPECRECQKVLGRLYREKNKDKINDKLRKKYKENPEIQKQRTKRWSETNENNYRETYKKSNKKWNNNNKEKRREYLKEYNKKRLKYDPLFKLQRNMRIRINKFIKNKKENSSKIIGCSYSFLKEFLEKKFKDGMCWENYGDWHIDHIIPLSSAKTEKEVYELCNFKNLQPLWSIENLKKGCKIL